jgi:hypothetical protein
MPDLNHLRTEHAELTVIANALTAMLKRDVPPPQHQLYDVRMRLASGLIRHLKTEDWVLYPKLLRSSDEQIAVTARAFSAEMGGLAKEFGGYAERWGADAIENDWEGYRSATAEIIRVLKLRMVREERDLYPLLDEATPERLTTHFLAA